MVDIVADSFSLEHIEFVMVNICLMTDPAGMPNQGETKAMPKNANKTRFDPYKNFKFRAIHSGGAVTRYDLPVPQHELAVLDQIIEQGKRRGDMTGNQALLVGPSQSARVAAAGVIADELGLDLYRVDLSKIVSRYIGDTEKHLRRIFDEVEVAGAVLFFDEADALFGKRTGVGDSHDRYAKLEVDYFLQRLDSFKGVVILATNRKSNLDEGFIRRIRYIVEFPLPRNPSDE